MAKRVIVLQGLPEVNEEDKAAEAITPGHLVNYNGSGDLVKHATAGAYAARTFALSREEMGKDIDTAYAIGDTVKVGSFAPGHRVNAIIASGVNASKGSLLESAGDGTLRVRTSGVAIGRSLEALNNSAGPSTSRLRVEII